MLRPGWTDTVLRSVFLLALSTLNGCAALGGGSAAPAAGGASAATRASATAQEAQSPEVQARYASLLNRLQAGDASATTELAQFSSENPELAGPLLNLGLVHAREGDEMGARTLFERASTVCSHCGAIWNSIGVLDRHQGRFADAEEAYGRAIELEPGYAPAYYNLAVLYEIYVPRPELALENYERYLQLGGTAGEGQDVEKWVADLRRRVGGTPKTASAEDPS